ncbi:dUTP diphosphatase [Bradyrhizobium sp. CCBAU 53351]|uniref:dUTP diphosphatase n=1 Tax=Bradyrhizobium sp. CCBAU 53351 TaxID=1325114 RepID=UPI001FEF9AF5|nr:dUTP diphosphatase [Bradyrhizobium sp. CCBAU 53351]
MPQYAHLNDAGLDLFAIEKVRLRPRDRSLVRTGILVQLPRATEGQIRPRSGLALQHGITVLNSPGTIDAGFRGEVLVLLVNLGEEDFEVLPGMKIAQLVISNVLTVNVQEVDDPRQLLPTDRGRRGLGSTGDK